MWIGWPAPYRIRPGSIGGGLRQLPLGPELLGLSGPAAVAQKAAPITGAAP